MRTRRGARLLPWILAALVVAAATWLAWPTTNVVHLAWQRMERRADRAGYAAHEIEGDGFRVRWRAGGEGPPVLFVHGFASAGTWNWGRQIGALPGHRLLIPDLPGFGASEVLPGAEPSLELEARALLAVLDAEGVERADVVASSYGGFVAVTLARLHPERVGRVVLIGSPGHTYSRADEREMLARLGIPSVEDLFLAPDPAGLRTVLGAATLAPAALVPRFLLRDLGEDLFWSHAAAKEALVEDLERRERLLPAPQRGAEALVVWGEEDGLFPVQTGERLARDLDACFVTVARAAHRPHADRPRRVNAVLSAYLDGEDPCGGADALHIP